MKATSKTYTKLSQQVGVARKTLYRWRDGKTDKFDEDKLEALADALDLNVSWIKHGIGPKYKDERLNQIESVVNDQGVDYKGLDQTLSGVESKAKNLIQDLQSLVDRIGSLRNKRS